MRHLFSKKRPRRDKITDPGAHASRYAGAGFHPVTEQDQWGPYAHFYTTTSDFGQVEGVRYYNNCGPTALTNLLGFYRSRYLPLRDGNDPGMADYDFTARYGVRHLFFINSDNRLFHGTSDLRAGRYIKRIFSKVLGIRPKTRFHRLTAKNARKALDSGALLYLMLWGHPEYRSHHLVGYGYLVFGNGQQEKTYLKVCDGHSPKPRFLDMADFEGHLSFFNEVRFPE